MVRKLTLLFLLCTLYIVLMSVYTDNIRVSEGQPRKFYIGCRAI